jgi:septal ring-binding cell division protein DamX
VATGTLEALPSGHYTIQLAAMFRHADLAPLLARDDVGDAFVAEVELDGTLYHALLTGVYDSEAAAVAAIERLPDDLRALEPWVRPVGSLQQANARAQRLVAESAAANAATP